MDGTRWMKAVRVPSPGIALTCDATFRHRPEVASLAPRVSAVGGKSATETSSTSASSSMPSRQSYVFPIKTMWLWPRSQGPGVGKESKEEDKEDAEEHEMTTETQRVSWVQNILRVGLIWAGKQEKATGYSEEEEEDDDDDDELCVGQDCVQNCQGCANRGEVADRMEFDTDSFSRLLRRVTSREALLFGKVALLSSLAYDIPKIKQKGLLKSYGLRFVASSFEDPIRGESLTTVEDPTLIQDQKLKEVNGEEPNNDNKQGETVTGLNDFVAYRIAASAASYLQSRTKGILPFSSIQQKSRKNSTEASKQNEGKGISIKEVSFIATTNSVTAVVAGKEEMKDAVAKDLNSAKSSPCGWYICDDMRSSTRYFVVQGSETLASWQANLLFEPIHFEDQDVLVHRGIYEVAKGIYQQMLPEIRAYIKSYGDSATLRFTGHSLGGSVALLLSLMLVIRGEVQATSLLPVVTFGSPSIMCGGNHLLHKLGLPTNHVQAITIHRDIVPRAFACHYPDNVANILKAINGNFRHHPCLTNQNLLYAPMGSFLILQPEEIFSPHHHLLPPDTGLYVLGGSSPLNSDSKRLLQAALSAFINSPHPLEILSDSSAYGSEGTVSRDHDMASYLRSIRAVIRQELKHTRKAKKEQQRNIWQPLAALSSLRTSIAPRQNASINSSQQHSLDGVRNPMKLFSWLVASGHLFLLLRSIDFSQRV